MLSAPSFLSFQMDAKNSNVSPCTYHMNSGNGRYSYSQNSGYQKELVDSAKKMLCEMIDENLETEDPSLGSSKTFRIVDLGCSIGPNTFFAIQNIIEAVEQKYKSKLQNPQTLEFHAFFNDHVGNDFNTLFKSLPSPRQYFASGVPGSFHGRLFPSNSVHVAHCSSSLHWLSRVPKELADRHSPAWNKGRIHYTGPAKEVREAYSAQFKEDMDRFLSARAKELVGGGLLLLTIFGIPDDVLPSETRVGMGFDVLQICLEDMAKMGKVRTEEVDSFNLPFYYPSPTELKASIEANGSYYIQTMERLVNPMRQETPDIQSCGLHLRAIIEGLIQEHFGKGVIDDLLERHVKRLASSAFMYDVGNRKEANYLVCLKRKG